MDLWDSDAAAAWAEVIDGDAVTNCYAEMAEVIERRLPLIPPGGDRDRLLRAWRHLRAAGSIPPLRLLP